MTKKTPELTEELEPWPEMHVHVRADIGNRCTYITLFGGRLETQRPYGYARTERTKQIGDCTIHLDESNRVTGIDWKPFDAPVDTTENQLDGLLTAVLKRQAMFHDLRERLREVNKLIELESTLVDLLRTGKG